MRTRTIVILVVAGLTLLVLAQLGGSSPEGAGSRSGDRAEPVTAEEPPAPTEPTLAEAPQPPTTTVAPTTPPEIERRGMGDPVARRWPLVVSLPKDAPGWRVDYRVDAERLVLTVTLRAVLNRPDQLAAYRTDLRGYKAQALEWIRSVGADPGAYPIEWRPPEAAGL